MDIDADGGLTLHEANLDAATRSLVEPGLAMSKHCLPCIRRCTMPDLAGPCGASPLHGPLRSAGFRCADASRIRKSTLVGNQKSKDIFVTDWFNPSP